MCLILLNTIADRTRTTTKCLLALISDEIDRANTPCWCWHQPYSRVREQEGSQRGRWCGCLLGAWLPYVWWVPRCTRIQHYRTLCKLDLKQTWTTHVAFRMSFVSWPVNTTIPYTHGVFLNCAPLNNIWSGPNKTVFSTFISFTSSGVPSYVYNELFGCSDRRVPCKVLARDGEVSE
jgi:hypothetical protein